jgi:nitric oxide reductase large subunit
MGRSILPIKTEDDIMAGGSGYATAMIGAVDMMTGAGADAAYEAAYGKFYSAAAGMINAGNQKVAAEANIAAIQQDKINTNVIIDMQQDKAEAQAKVAAAVSGTEGQSVSDTIYETEINSSVAKSNNRARAQQQVEQQLAQVYQSQSTLLALDNPEVSSPSILSSIAKNLAPHIVANRGEMVEKIDSLFETSGDVLQVE